MARSIVGLRSFTSALICRLSNNPNCLAIGHALALPESPRLSGANGYLYLVLNGYEVFVQFPLCQMKPGFHGTQGDLSFRRDFALTHPFEESQMNYLLLCFRQFLNRAVEKF